jgi:hypothetical protein
MPDVFSGERQYVSLSCKVIQSRKLPFSSSPGAKNGDTTEGLSLNNGRPRGAKALALTWNNQRPMIAKHAKDKLYQVCGS